MKTKLFLFVILIFYITNLTGQINFNINDINANPGDEVVVPLIVSNFHNVVALGEEINWDPNVLEFVEVFDFNAGSLNANDFGTDSVQNGKLYMSFVNDDLGEINLPDGSAIYKIKFRAIGCPFTSSSVILKEPTEVYDGDGNLLAYTISNGSVNLGSIVYNEWLGFTSNWDQSLNWTENKVPDKYTNVKITNSGVQPIITTAVEVNNLFIDNNATLTVEPSASLTVKGCTLENNGTLILEADSNFTANLLDDAQITGSGEFIVNKYMKAGGYHYVSPSVNSATSSVFGGRYTIYYNETDTTSDWMNGWIQVGVNAPLQIAKGYGVYCLQDFMLTFEGKVNSGTYTFPITHTDGNEIPQHEGWNFIGNPYPSAIDIDKIDFKETTAAKAIYFWNPVKKNYDYYVLGSHVNTATHIIPPGQGFFVFAYTDGNFVFKNSYRTISNGISYKRNTENQDTVENLRIKIVQKNNDLTDEMLLIDRKYTTEAFEYDFDALKILSQFDGDLPQIFSYNPEYYYFAINSLNFKESLPINLGYRANNWDTFYLEFEKNTAEKIYLLDKYDNKIIEIKDQEKYTFYSDSGLFADRFEVFSYQEFTENEEIEAENTRQENIMIYPNPTTYFFRVLTNKKIDFVEIWTLSGKLIKKTYNSYVNVEDLFSGVYILKIYVNGEFYENKLIIL